MDHLSRAKCYIGLNKYPSSISIQKSNSCNPTVSGYYPMWLPKYICHLGKILQNFKKMLNLIGLVLGRFWTYLTGGL